MKRSLIAVLVCLSSVFWSEVPGMAQEKAASGGKSILWASTGGKWSQIYTDAAKKQFESAGWKFTLTTPELAASETPSVFLFNNLNNDIVFQYLQAWPVIWEKVKAGAMLVIQPGMNITFTKLTDDDSLFCRIRPIGKTRDRKGVCLQGEWLDKPCNLKEAFQKCITPASFPEPEVPRAWQTLASQPVGENNLRGPFILFRPYGKGFVVVFCKPNYNDFSLFAVMNIYENREALRGKSL